MCKRILIYDVFVTLFECAYLSNPFVYEEERNNNSDDIRTRNLHRSRFCFDFPLQKNLPNQMRATCEYRGKIRSMHPSKR